MKRFSWKKLMSLVVALALVVGVLHFGTRVSAGADAGASAALSNGNIQFTVDRDFLKTGGEQAKSDVVIAIDCSSSMNNRDTGIFVVRNGHRVQLTRLEVALDEAGKFKEELDKDPKVNVVAIYKFDKSAVKVNTIDEITSGNGTNIDDALYQASNELKSEGITNPTIVILTDGEPYHSNSEGDATTNTVARINSVLGDGIKIYAINYGTQKFVFYNKGITDTNNNLSTINTGFDSQTLAAAFKNITTAIQTFKVDTARIVAELTDFVNYVGPVSQQYYYLAYC